MKAITGLIVLALASTAVGEDSEERKRASAEKLADLSNHMSAHLRKVGGGHSEAPPASLMRHARKDEDDLRATEPTAKAEHAEKIRRVADQINEQHRRHMERPIAHDLLKARAAHSFADMKATEDGRKPSVAKDSAAKNAKKKESLDKLAKHMSQHIDASAVRNAAARGDPRMIKAAHDAVALASGHGAAPVRERMDAAHLHGMHRLAQTGPQKRHRKDAEAEDSNPAEGEE